MYWFGMLDRGDTRLGVAGKIMSAEEVQGCLRAGMDFVLIGRGAILHHDYPRRVMFDPCWEPMATPVSPDHLLEEGLSEKFIKYMHAWPGFVAGTGSQSARAPSSFKKRNH
jgi:hypothetical protein